MSAAGTSLANLSEGEYYGKKIANAENAGLPPSDKRKRKNRKSRTRKTRTRKNRKTRTRKSRTRKNRTSKNRRN